MAPAKSSRSDQLSNQMKMSNSEYLGIRFFRSFAWLGRLGMSRIMFESEGPWIMVFTLVYVVATG